MSNWGDFQWRYDIAPAVSGNDTDSLVEGLASGFGFGASLRAASSESLYLLLGFHLPALALAAVTSNFMEAVVTGLGIFLAFVAFMMSGNNFRGRFDPTNHTGLHWYALLSSSPPCRI